MATLYLGERAGAAGFARRVAIKVIHPNLAGNERFVNLFIREAKLAARIQDPRVVHVEAPSKRSYTLGAQLGLSIQLGRVPTLLLRHYAWRFAIPMKRFVPRRQAPSSRLVPRLCRP